MDESMIKTRFNAAVNVIRGLPKNGSYQPSSDMQLRFYSFYKQATLGPCSQRKPPFWDVVNRAKYDAYMALGKMPSERAMELYVEELKKIIETMSYTDNVAEFMGSINELNGIDVEDLETLVPETVQKMRSHPNSPFASREASPIRVPLKQQQLQINGLAMTNGNHIVDDDDDDDNNGPMTNGHSTVAADYSDDEYIDTVDDDVEPIQHYARQTIRMNGMPMGRAQMTNGSIYPSTTTTTATTTTPMDTNATATVSQVLNIVQNMQIDLQQMQHRIGSIEESITEIKNHQLRHKIHDLKYPKWWPFTQISPSWFAFMLIAPFLLQRMTASIQQRSRK